MSTNSNDMPPLKVAILGSGIFATTSHAPVLQKHADTFACVAVWSRTLESAQKLAGTFEHCQAYGGQDGLHELLRRSDIEACIMCLPLDVQPTYVPLVLQAGKHLLSEKPIAPTVQLARQLVQEYRHHYDASLVWSVAENYRYEPAMIQAAQAVKKIGTPLVASLLIRAPFSADNQYVHTEWRKNASWGYGGFFIDAFPHGAAALRLVLGDEPTAVSATTKSHAEHLPGVDTMAGQLRFRNGIVVALSITYVPCKSRKFALEVTGTEGSCLLERYGIGYKLTINDSEEKEIGFGGVEGELFAFAKACRKVGSDANTPEEALGDIRLVEACLESGKKNGELVELD